MAIKAAALTVALTLWDTYAGVPKIGDAANLSLRVVKDGVAAAATNTPVELDAVNDPGVYTLALTAAEMNANSVSVTGKSSTAGVVVIPVHLVTEQGKLADLDSDLTRLLGLSQENWVLRSPAFDADGNLETATVRLYDSAAHAETDDGSTGIVAVYAIENTYTDGVLTKSTQTRVS
jgi:hypothetical protein